MMNLIWGGMFIGGIAYAAAAGRVGVVAESAMQAAEYAAVLAFQLVGVMCLWLGMMKLAERAGLIRLLAALLRPLLRLLFCGVPKEHPAMGMIVMTISANLLGLGNAATPFGIKAMQELQTLNPHKDKATPPMCTLLALTTTGFTVVPATVMALRLAAGSSNAAEIVGVTLAVSFWATVIALTADALFRKIFTGI